MFVALPVAFAVAVVGVVRLLTQPASRWAAYLDIPLREGLAHQTSAIRKAVENHSRDKSQSGGQPCRELVAFSCSNHSTSPIANVISSRRSQTLLPSARCRPKMIGGSPLADLQPSAGRGRVLRERVKRHVTRRLPSLATVGKGSLDMAGPEPRNVTCMLPTRMHVRRSG